MKSATPTRRRHRKPQITPKPIFIPIYMHPWLSLVHKEQRDKQQWGIIKYNHSYFLIIIKAMWAWVVLQNGSSHTHLWVLVWEDSLAVRWAKWSHDTGSVAVPSYWAPLENEHHNAHTVTATTQTEQHTQYRCRAEKASSLRCVRVGQHGISSQYSRGSAV